MSTRAHKPSEILRGIAESFPCLRGCILDACFFEGQFDPDDLARNMRYWSHGEKLAARFILTVWNPSEARKRGWRFDAAEALAVWDSDNRAAYIAWCRNPIYP
jgi:hypothetical protein